MAEILNIPATLKRIDEDAERLKDLYAVALEEFPKWKIKLKEAIESKDPTLIKKIAHSYKGSSATLGAEILFELFLEIEKLAFNDQLDKVTELYIKSFEGNLTDLIDAISEYRSS